MSASFNSIISKFDKKGEKTGWTYILIPERIALEIKPGNRKSFRVKGTLDNCMINGVALIPMGKGEFILPLNNELRKKTGKGPGDTIAVKIEEDKSPVLLNPEFMECLADAPDALGFFNTLPGSHRNYFSKWIESAKTEVTRTKRIVEAITALSNRMSFAEMVRANKR